MVEGLVVVGATLVGVTSLVEFDVGSDVVGYPVGVRLEQVSITRQIFPLPSSFPLDMVSDLPPEPHMRLNLIWTIV